MAGSPGPGRPARNPAGWGSAWAGGVALVFQSGGSLAAPQPAYTAPPGGTTLCPASQSRFTMRQYVHTDLEADR
jgi:hypothetical protein